MISLSLSLCLSLCLSLSLSRHSSPPPHLTPQIIERGKSVNALEMTSLVVMFLTLISAMLLNERFLDEARAEKLLGSESEQDALGTLLGMPVFGSDIM